MKLSIYNILLFYIAISLIPRLVSDYALDIGTIFIIFFWLPILVILPEISSDSFFEPKRITKLPLFFNITLCVLLVIILLSLCFKNIIYDKNANLFISSVRRCLYLVHPLMLMSLYPLILKHKKHHYLKLLAILTFLMYSLMIVPPLLVKTSLTYLLNCYTAKVSAFLLSLFSYASVTSIDATFGNSDFTINIERGCSCIPLIFHSFGAFFVFYLSVKIISKIKLLFVFLNTIIIAFLFNSIRVAILGKIVSLDKMELFDFWHSGAGSLIFSFVIMGCTSFVYYLVWCSENPKVN